MQKFLILLSPFAPHLAEELWLTLGNKEFISQENWPEYDPKLIIDDMVKIAIQINGKLREVIEVEPGLNEEALKEKVLVLPKIIEHTTGKEIKKVIYIPDKMFSIVI